MNTTEKPEEGKLSRNARILGICSFLSDSSSEMLYPVLPIFLTQIIHAPVTIVGLIEGISVAAANIVTVFSGYLSDRLGRRKAVAFTGAMFSAFSRPIIGLASAWQLVMAARVADRLGKGIRSAPKQALLAESASAASRGRVFGYDRAMDALGSVVGPLLGILFISGLGLEIRSIFFIAAVPAFLAALMLLAVREPRDEAKAQAARPSFRGLTPDFKKFLVVAAVFGLANSANAFLILRAQQLGFGATAAILAYALFNAVSSIAAMPAGSASDRFGRRNVLIIGYSIYALVYLGFGVANQGWTIWLLFAAYGFFPALTDGVGKALAVDTAGRAGRATAIGLYSFVSGVTSIAASYIGGQLWDKVDASATFYFGAALATLAVLLLLLILPARARVQEVEAKSV